MYSGMFLKGSLKLWTSLFSVMLENVFTKRTFKGHSKGAWGTRALERCSDTQGIWSLGHSGTWVLYLAFEALYLADSNVKYYS